MSWQLLIVLSSTLSDVPASTSECTSMHQQVHQRIGHKYACNCAKCGYVVYGHWEANGYTPGSSLCASQKCLAAGIKYPTKFLLASTTLLVLYVAPSVTARSDRSVLCDACLWLQAGGSCAVDRA